MIIARAFEGIIKLWDLMDLGESSVPKSCGTGGGGRRSMSASTSSGLMTTVIGKGGGVVPGTCKPAQTGNHVRFCPREPLPPAHGFIGAAISSSGRAHL